MNFIDCLEIFVTANVGQIKITVFFGIFIALIEKLKFKRLINLETKNTTSYFRPRSFSDLRHSVFCALLLIFLVILFQSIFSLFQFFIEINVQIRR